MFLKLISNINYLFYFFCITFVLLILTYIIYKLFLLEADVYMIVEKINNIELEFSGSSSSKSSSNSCNSSNSKCIYKPKSNDTINISEMMMNEVFNNTINSVIEPVKKEVDIIDIDEIIGEVKEKEEEVSSSSNIVFDLKKEIINNDTESVVSSSTNQLTKKQLQKLNVDKLKEKCNELELSTEGTKSQLIDRILEEMNKDV